MDGYSDVSPRSQSECIIGLASSGQPDTFGIIYRTAPLYYHSVPGYISDLIPSSPPSRLSYSSSSSERLWLCDKFINLSLLHQAAAVHCQSESLVVIYLLHANYWRNYLLVPINLQRLWPSDRVLYFIISSCSIALYQLHWTMAWQFSPHSTAITFGVCADQTPTTNRRTHNFHFKFNHFNLCPKGPTHSISITAAVVNNMQDGCVIAVSLAAARTPPFVIKSATLGNDRQYSYNKNRVGVFSGSDEYHRYTYWTQAMPFTASLFLVAYDDWNAAKLNYSNRERL